MLQTLQIPDLGEEDTEGTILSILVQNGASVQIGDILLEVETDKVVLEIPAPSAGIIKELLVKDGDTVVYGSDYLKMTVLNDATSEPLVEGTDALDKNVPDKNVPDKMISDKELVQPPKTDLSDQQEKTPVSQTSPHRRVPRPASNLNKGDAVAPAGPAARRLARELGINIGVIAGSGSSGRITRDDVKAFAKNLIGMASDVSSSHRTPSHGKSTGRATEAVKRTLPDQRRYGDVEIVPLSRIDRTTASNMSYSASEIPHAWVQGTIDITDVEAARKTNKIRWLENGHQVTLTAIICQALAKAMQKFPRFNSVLDVEKETIIYKQYVNVGVAVDTPKGLVVPSLKGVDKKDLLETADELTRLSGATRTGKLKVSDLKGAGMTLSNLGGLGVSGILPIVNWPEVAILGVAAGEIRPTYIDNEFLPRLMMPVTLGFDHRVINGADAARFLEHLKEALETATLDIAALDTD